MPTHVFNFAKAELLRADIDLETGDIRAVACMTNTTADTDNDAVTTVANITTFDQFDGANWIAGGMPLDNQIVNVDDANDRAEFDADDETINALGAGTRAIDGILLILWVTTVNDSVPVTYLQFGTPKTPDGSNFTFQWNTEGLVQAT